MHELQTKSASSKTKMWVENKSTRKWTENLKFGTNIICMTLIWFMKKNFSEGYTHWWRQRLSWETAFPYQLKLQIWQDYSMDNSESIREKNSIDHAQWWYQREIWKTLLPEGVRTTSNLMVLFLEWRWID